MPLGIQQSFGDDIRDLLSGHLSLFLKVVFYLAIFLFVKRAYQASKKGSTAKDFALGVIEEMLWMLLLCVVALGVAALFKWFVNFFPQDWFSQRKLLKIGWTA